MSEMETWEGYQLLRLKDAKDYIKRKKLKKVAIINKDVKPYWWGDDKWKQTYTIQKISKQSDAVKKAIKELIK